MPWLSILIWSPIILGLICTLVPNHKLAWGLAAGGLVGLFGISVYLFGELAANTLVHGPFQGYAWIEQVPWFTFVLNNNTLPLHYLRGVDGISLPLVVLSFVVFLIGLFVAYNQYQRYGKYFLLLYLALLSMVLGALCSLDLLVFFIFFELVSLPTYLLIASYGSASRGLAAMQYLVYAFIGSVLFLLVIVGIYSSLSPTLTEVIPLNVLSRPDSYAPQGLLNPYAGDTNWGTIAFFALLVTFGIKLAIVPFHGWLPKAHVESSTPVSIVLAGVVLKLGGYAMLRIAWGIFHRHMLAYGDILIWVGGITIVYAVLNALAQQDIKRMIAYSSIGHMGFVWLGILSSMDNGLIGAMYEMISHGLVVAGLFIIANILEERFGSRQIGHFSGLFKHMPWYTVLALLFFFANFAMPGSANFIAEVFILMGFLEACVVQHINWYVLLLIGGGILLSAACWIWTFRRMFQGKYYIHQSTSPPKDLLLYKRTLLATLVVLIYLLGILPQELLSTIHPAVQQIKQLVFMFKT